MVESANRSPASCASSPSECIGDPAEGTLGHGDLERPSGRHRHWIRHLTAGPPSVYLLIQKRQDGLMQRSIREVNTSSRWCVLWDLDEDTHYSVQVQSVGLHGDSPPSRAVHFRTLERTDHYPAGVLDHHEPAMEGLGMTPQLETGELLIITTVLLLWAAVIALFCRQYDIIKDNDSNGTKEKAKRPLVRATSSYYNASAGSSPIYHNGAVRSSRLHRASSSISIIRV
ncbi:fibronectin type III domain-containing protein 5-like isoform X2 [Oreochromis aureus]|uniref:Fibronectin type III domain containing 4b n=1 Tax=Oreochromis niloticus TaxID=8128 RepID=A0A669C3Z8_ORENI|nr:fibronectin type III domain-containing protein 5-like isoform X2 [Oreochromis aureus]